MKPAERTRARRRLVDRVGHAMDRVFDRLRHESAFLIDEENATEGSLESIAGSTYYVLVTHRADGSPVPTPVWAGRGSGGALYIKTRASSGKVRRTRKDSRVVIFPSTMRGRPRGPAFKATCREITRSEWDTAEQALKSSYGLGRRLAEAGLGGSDDVTYLEVRERR